MTASKAKRLVHCCLQMQAKAYAQVRMEGVCCARVGQVL